MNISWQDKKFVLDKIEGSPHAILKADATLQNDRAFILAAIKVNTNIYPHLVEKFRDDKEITLIAVNHTGANLRIASKKMQDDEDIVLAALDNYPGSFSYVSERLKNNPEIVLAAVKKWPHNFRHASLELRDNEQFAKKMVTLSYEPYSALSARLQTDETIMRLALSHVDFLMESSFINYELLPENLKNDRDFMLLFITKIPDNYPLINEEFKNDREFVIAYVTKFSYSFKQLPEEFMRDKEIALIVVKRRGYYLKHFGEFADDLDVVKAALIERGVALEFASERLRRDLELCAYALRRDRRALSFIAEELHFAPPIVAERIRHGDLQYNDLALELREDANVTIEALRKVHDSLGFSRLDIPKKLYSNAEVVKVAARKTIDALANTSSSLLDNKQFVRELIAQRSNWGEHELLKYVSSRLQNDEEVVNEAITLNALNFKYASKSLRNNEQLGYIAVSKKEELYHSLSDNLQQNSDFIIKLLQANKLVFIALDEKRRGDFTFAQYITGSPRALAKIAPKLANDQEFIKHMLNTGRSYDLKQINSELFSDLEFMQELIAINLYAIFAMKIKRDNIPVFKDILTEEQYDLLAPYTIYKIEEYTENFKFYFKLEQKGQLTLRDFNKALLFTNHEYTPVILAHLKGVRHKKKLLLKVLFNAIENEFIDIINVIFNEQLIRRRAVLHHYDVALKSDNKTIIKLFSDYVKPLPLTYEELNARKKASGW